jgi:rhodanese-related sulfurtransferase
MSRKRKLSKSAPSGSKSRQPRKTQRQITPWLWVGLGVIVIAAVVYFLWPKTTLPGEITVAQAYQKFQQEAFFLDVRSQAEWDQIHIPRSTLIPLDELPNRLSELPQSQDIVVVCLSGHRSQEGMTILRQAGFARAACMTGGITAWQAAGYPLEDSNP